MTQNAASEHEVAQADGSQGPGHRLRKARESRGMEAAAVAQDLRVDVKVIQAIDRDDFNGLMPVFVRGYLRSYARLVGLPHEPVVAAYDRRIGHEPPPLVVRSAVKTQLRSSDRHVRWVTYLIVMALLALVFLWWRNEANLRFWEVATHVPADQTMTELEPIAAPPAANDTPTVGDDSGYAVLQPLPDIDLPTLTAGTASSRVDLPAAGTTGGEMTTAPAPSTPPMPETVSTEAPATAATPAASAASAASAAAPGADTPPAAQTGDLVLSFSAECWVDIRSADGQKLLYGTMAADTRHALSGKAPFSLVLGNAGAVTVTHRGQAIDVNRHTVGNVARFKLGDPL